MGVTNGDHQPIMHFPGNYSFHIDPFLADKCVRDIDSIYQLIVVQEDDDGSFATRMPQLRDRFIEVLSSMWRVMKEDPERRLKAFDEDESLRRKMFEIGSRLDCVDLVDSAFVEWTRMAN